MNNISRDIASSIGSAASKKIFFFAKIFAAVVAFLILLSAASYTVGAGEYGVVTRFGKVINVTQEGLHFKAPFVDDVNMLPSSVVTTQEDNVLAVSSDMQDVSTVVNVQFTIPPSSVPAVYKNYRNVKALNDNLVRPVIQSVTKEIVARFPAVDLVGDRKRVDREVTQTLSERLNKASGLTVQKVEMVNFGFSDSFTKAIEEKVVAGQAVQTEKQMLERKKVEAERLVVEAEAQAKATRARADAEAYQLAQQSKSVSDLTIRLREAQALQDLADAEKLKAQNWRPEVISGGPVQVPARAK